MYVARHIEEAVKESARMFAAVVITGPRQVGKTTMLEQVFSKASYTTLDRVDVLEAAQADPERFLQLQEEPAIIDEIQYAPMLFRYIKIASDRQKQKKGRFFLTGSQRYAMMQGVDESMAGRAGIVEMLGLSMREIAQSSFKEPFLPSEAFIQKRRKAIEKSTLSTSDIWDILFKGDLPELHVRDSISPMRYYDSYVETYLNRDVRNLAHVGDLMRFNRFLAFVSLIHGKQLNKSDLAEKAGISVPTVERWLSVLEASNIIYLLKPFYANSKKRLVKTPKLYFLNSGLAARLQGFESASTLEGSREAGSFFEGFVIAEIIKSHLNTSGAFPELYYYRDSNRNEVDLIITKGNKLYPIEIKKTSRAKTADIRAFLHLDELAGYQREQGALICNASEVLPLGKRDWVIPASYL